MSNESLVPHIGIVTDVRVDTPDVKTFRVQALTGEAGSEAWISTFHACCEGIRHNMEHLKEI